MRKIWGVLAVVAMLAVAGPARALDTSPVTKTVQTVRNGVAAECRRLGVWPERCGTISGIPVSEARVDAYQSSWVHRALTLQRGIDDGVSFLRQLIPHTHNTFNSSAYYPTLTNQDPNQLYTIGDQLRMDIRGIEMDLHNFPSLFNDVVLCHGQSTPVGPVIVQIGCSVDRPFRAGLLELRQWLDAPGNDSEVVLLYLENQLNNDAHAHDVAAADIAGILGNLVYRPAAHGAPPCAPMPTQMSRAQIRATGARVLIVGNCGPGAWGSWVHERGPQWDESSSPAGDDYPDYPACLAERQTVGYSTHFVRRYEDSTWLSAVTGPPGSQLTLTETGRMVRCGVNLVGFDQLRPEDPRLAALVWSWATDEPRIGAGDCAAQGGDGHLRATACGQALHFACITALGSRFISTLAGDWSQGAAACAGGTVDMPANGYENELVRDAKRAAGVTDVWVRYHRAGATWSVA